MPIFHWRFLGSVGGPKDREAGYVGRVPQGKFLEAVGGASARVYGLNCYMCVPSCLYVHHMYVGVTRLEETIGSLELELLILLQESWPNVYSPQKVKFKEYRIQTKL